MKPSQVGFDGTFHMVFGGKKVNIILARSDKPPEYFEKSPNFNFLLPNTFMWYKKDDPELLYRSKTNQLYKVNFEPL